MKPVCLRCNVPYDKCSVVVDTPTYYGTIPKLNIVSPSGQHVVPFAYVCPICGHVELFVKTKKNDK